jgi:hypothetical protein
MRFPSPGHGAPCFNCGREATAAWTGAAGTLGACSGCAITVLPGLIAAAVNFAPGADQLAAHEHALDCVEGAYWKAAFRRVLDAPLPDPNPLADEAAPTPYPPADRVPEWESGDISIPL